MSAAPGSPTPPTPGAPSRRSEGLAARAVEYFTLRAAEAELARLPELARAEVAEGIELARQQTAAAEALFAVGHTVEALRLAKEGLATTEAAAERYARALGLTVASGTPAVEKAAPASEDAKAEDAKAEDAKLDEADAKLDEAKGAEEKATEEKEEKDEERAAVEVAPSAPIEAEIPAWKRLAQAAGTSSARIAATERALVEVHKLALPRLEKDVSPAHVESFRDLLRARAEIEDTLLPATHTKGSLLGARIWRGATTGLLALATVLGLYYALRPVEGTFVRASATWADSPDFRADYIIDGDENTMWLLPEHTGWVEVRTAPPIPSIHRITLVNAGTSRVSDRGTREYRVEIYSDGRLEQQIDGEFGDELGATVTHEVSVSDVERIRFVARSGYRVGAGLTELRWE